MSSKEIICQGEELFRLIPQRPPMVMIDRFYGIEENTILVRADRHYRQPVLPGRCITGNGNHRAHRPVGGGTCRLYLYAAERTCTIRFYRFGRKMKLFRLPSAGAELYTGITIVQEVFDITLITAEVKENDELLAECRMKIYLKKE